VIYGYPTGLDPLAIPDQLWTQMYMAPPILIMQ